MRPPRLVPLLLLGALLAGCAAPESQHPEPTQGPIDLRGEHGVLVVDRQTRAIETLAPQPARAWLSPNATVVTWSEGDFHVVIDQAKGSREISAPIGWARIYDNGTGLELTPGEARLRNIQTGETLATSRLPSAPREGGAWSAASDDLRVLGLELPGERPLACRNEIIIREERSERTLGCHLRIAADGRVGWTEATAVRIRTPDGAVINLTEPGSGDVANASFVAHENPVFTRDGILYLRITGGEKVALTEIVDDDGAIIATMPGPRRLALLDASEDGRYLLLTAFER